MHASDLPVWAFPTLASPSTWCTTEVAAALAQRPETVACPSDTALPQVPDSDNYYLANNWNLPAGTKLAVASYAAVMGTLGPADASASDTYKYANNGVFFYAKQMTAAEIRDGLSNTMFYGETTEGHLQPDWNIWTYAAPNWELRSTTNPLNTPPDLNLGSQSLAVPGLGRGFTNANFASKHPNGANFVFGDGHVDFLSDSINLSTYQALSTRDKGEVAAYY